MIGVQDYKAIVDSFGCDNCKNNYDHPWNENCVFERDYCERCNPDCSPPSNYRPFKQTVQNKAYNDRFDEITASELSRFYKEGY